MEQQTDKILAGYTDQEKGAYLGAIASIATADRSASEDELNHLRTLAQAAELSPEQEAAVVRAAEEMSPEELKKCLDILKTSKLKYSLIADVMTFAKVDGNYTEEEKGNIKKISDYLGVDQQQFSLLDNFVDKATESQQNPSEVRQPEFLQSMGLKEKFENAGINVGSLSRGLLGMLGPVLLGRMVAKGLQGRTGGMFGRNRAPIPSGRGFGGLGSIFSMLNQRGSYRGMGSILPGLFR